MTPPPYTEDSFVQEPTADYLRDELGWESVYAHNKEGLGPDSLLGRTSEREVVLTRILRESLVKLNPNLPALAYDEAVRMITSAVASQTIVAVNRDKYEMILKGVRVTFKNENGEREKKLLRLFDFNTPENNRFLCVRELWIKGDPYHRRPDIIGFVNGLPLLFMECKNIDKNLKVAFEANYSDYKDTIPQIFHYNAFVMFGNGEHAKIGTITGKWEHFHEWSRLAEEDSGVVDMETMLKGVCNKRNFMDLLENFILFDESSGETKKILARNHQFLGVNRAVDAIAKRKAHEEHRLGVFWHTQGAGKSYSMVFLTRKVHRKLGGNFTFLILTDRDDLDTQIYKTFAGCGVVDNDSDPCRASSGTHLRQLLAEQKSHLFSLIQKFNNEDIDPHKGYTLREDVIVISDEAHRTQYGNLALNMRRALPNAGYIGFTGTPLFTNDEITRRVFGEYVSTYDFQRAVEDNATVPLYYDARGDKLKIAIDNLNERIIEKIEEWEVDDIDAEQRLERDLKREYHIITADKRLDRIARDFVQHYSTAWESGKAMLVCIDKVTCVRMYNLIAKYWNTHTERLETELKQRYAARKDDPLQKRVDWMRETRMAVIVSEEQGEVEKFRKRGLDIIPHRRLIKDGIELPEAMRNVPKFRNMLRMEPDEAFKEREHPFRIAIVCAMWLTGFDVPSLANLYIDKPLKAHTLMQAIARANRVHEGKNNGLIIDYCGILQHLRKALATFAGTLPEGEGRVIDPARPHQELLAELAEAIEATRVFLRQRKASPDDVIQQDKFKRIAAVATCKEAVNENDETRKRFELLCREVFRKFKACINIEGINEHRTSRDAIDIIYKSLQQDRDNADIGDILRKLQNVVDEAIDVEADQMKEPSELYDISKIDFERLKREFGRSLAKRTTMRNLMYAIEQRLRRLLEQNPLRADFQRRYEEIVAKYNREKDRVTIEQTFEALLDMTQELGTEELRAVREGLDEESLAIFDLLLSKHDLTPTEIARIKKVARDLLQTLKGKIGELDHWREKEINRDAVRVIVHDFLWSDETGLPPETYLDNEVSTIIEDVFRHIHHAYPTVPSPYYPQAA